MKHLFELPKQFPQTDDKIVIIHYQTRAAITKEFEHDYNVACSDKWTAEQNLDDALYQLNYYQGTPEPLQDPEKLNALSWEHKLAVDEYERAVKKVHDLDNTLVNVELVERDLQITVVNLDGVSSPLRLYTVQDLQTINSELENLRQMVASNQKPFHDARQQDLPY